MTRKQACKLEKTLRSIGVYKPYVSASDGKTFIESYPLTAVLADGGCDPEQGPFTTYTISDYSLSRMCSDPVLTTGRIFLGQDTLGVVGRSLVGFHKPAYARAKAQDAEYATRLAQRLDVVVEVDHDRLKRP